MTREHRLVLSLDEVRAVRWRCPACQAALTLDLSGKVTLPSTYCPNCNEPMANTDEWRQALDAANHVIAALRAARSSKVQLLQLEFDEERTS